MDHAVLDGEADAAGVRETDADARVLHCAGEADVFGLVVVGLDGLEGFHKTGGVVDDLAVGQFLAGADRVAVADFPRRDAYDVGHLV